MVFMAHHAADQAVPKSPASTVVSTYDTLPTGNTVVPMVKEISGIADSKKNPGHLWAQEDSGNPTQLYLLDYQGKVKKKVFLKGTTNRDWEDMALSGTDLFVADFGDNRQIYSSCTIYQFAEPSAAEDTVYAVRKIEFNYPDGAHDAEAFLIDHATKDIYIFTKRDAAAQVYKLSAPYKYQGRNTLEHVVNLPFTGIVGAAQSADGSEIILKTYSSLYHYKRAEGEPLQEVLRREPVPLPYLLEPQGEAIAFAHDHSGFFTLSEKGFAPTVNLYFYRRR